MQEILARQKAGRKPSFLYCPGSNIDLQLTQAKYYQVLGKIEGLGPHPGHAQLSFYTAFLLTGNYGRCIESFLVDS